MNPPITYGSVCSGIEAATVAWHPLGWKPLWFAQFDPTHNYKRQPDFPSRVLQHHYPNVPNLGNLIGIADKVRSGQVEAPDVLAGGTPCQSFSVAGLRGGLTDTRGQLTLEYIKLYDAINHIRYTRGQRNCIALWENVPGVLTDNTNAFGCLLSGLVGASEPLTTTTGKWPSYGVVACGEQVAVWRVLDAQYFGVPQRRRRVFLVAGASADVGRFAEILFESQSEGRDPEASRKAREATAGDVGAGVKAVGQTAKAGTIGYSESGTPDTNHGTSGGNAPLLAPPVLCMATKQMSQSISEDVAPSILANDYKEPHAVAVYDNHPHDSRVTGPLDVAPTVSSRYGTGGGNVPLVQSSCIIRRLTPIECERLQGFPDDYTNIPGASDGPRYKALGNSMAVPVMRWIARRIQRYIGQ
jgi:DNA (cytosine-5)-methyltransferase 1